MFFLCINRLSGIYIGYQNRSRHDPGPINLSLLFFTLLHTYTYIPPHPQMSLFKVSDCFEQVNQVPMFSCGISNFLLLVAHLLESKECKSFHNSASYFLHITCHSIRSRGLTSYCLCLLDICLLCLFDFFWLTLLCFPLHIQCILYLSPLSIISPLGTMSSWNSKQHRKSRL